MEPVSGSVGWFQPGWGVAGGWTSGVRAGDQAGEGPVVLR